MFDSARQEEARSLCAGCPVQELCLWATLQDEPPNGRFGIAGAMGPAQRAALAARLSPAVVEAAQTAALAAWAVRGRRERRVASPPAPASPAPALVDTANGDSGREPAAEAVVAMVASAFGVGPEQLHGPSRTRHVVEARHVAMYVLREGRGLSYPAIGRALGGRDNTTAMNAVIRMRARLEGSPALRKDVERLVATAGDLKQLMASAGGSVVIAGNTRAEDHLLEEVARVSGVRTEQLRGRSRMRHVAEARQVAMYVLRAQGLSYPAIGRALGGRDHTTAMHGVERVRKELAKPGPFRERVELLLDGPAVLAA
jgi:hypothetical protein